MSVLGNRHKNIVNKATKGNRVASVFCHPYHRNLGVPICLIKIREKKR